MRHHRDPQPLPHQLQQAVHIVDLQAHRPAHPRRRERLVGGPPGTPVRMEVDERRPRQLLPPHLRPPGERVPRRAQQHHRLPGQRHQLPAPLRRADRRGERQVEASAYHPFQQAAGALLPQPQLHLRVLPVERRQQPRRAHPRHALLDPDRQRPAQQPPYGIDRVPRRPRARQRALRLHQQRPTGLGEPDRARGPAEQRGPQLLLQRPYGGGEPGLRHGEALGGAGEVLLLGDGDEVLQLTQFHD